MNELNTVKVEEEVGTTTVKPAIETTGGTEVIEEVETSFKLSKPIVFEGKKYDSLDLNFENLTGADVEKAEMQYIAENPANQMTMVKEMSKGYAAIVASKAAGVHVALIRALSASDYSKITMRTSIFLMRGK